VNATVRCGRAVDLVSAAESADVSSPATKKPRLIGLLQASALASGVGMAFIVARDGSPPWQVTRLGVAAGVAAAAIVVLGRGGRSTRAAVAFTLGVVTTAIGAGIAPPHVTKVGWHVMTAAGGMVLGFGLVLMLAGAALALGVASSWRRVLLAPALLFSAFVVVFALGQAVAATNVPRTAVDATTPADVGMPYRDVEFQTTDGVTLSGWYVPSANGAAVVLLHGAGSTRSSVLDHAVVLARHGYGVVMFDARGHGRSGGRAMDFGWYGDEDIAAATALLEDQPEVDAHQIAAVGMSMGGEEAIGAAATNPLIRAVVAEGATNRVAGDKAWLSETFGARGAIQEGIDWLLYKTADLLTAADPPMRLREAVAAAAPRPVLLITAGDVDGERRAAEHIQRGSPDTVEIWIAPDAGHTRGLHTHPDEWEQHVLTFLGDALSIDRIGQ
jgi:uncharacterized protein